MELIQIFKQIVKEYWSSVGGKETWVEPIKYISLDSGNSDLHDEIKKYPDVELFFNTLNIEPKRGAINNYFYENKEILKFKQNPFKRGTWSHYVWNIYWLNIIQRTDNDEECKKNITLRKKLSSLANKIHPTIDVSFGDNDC